MHWHAISSKSSRLIFGRVYIFEGSLESRQDITIAHSISQDVDSAWELITCKGALLTKIHRISSPRWTWLEFSSWLALVSLVRTTLSLECPHWMLCKAQYSVSVERPCPMDTVTFTCTAAGDGSRQMLLASLSSPPLISMYPSVYQVTLWHWLQPIVRDYDSVMWAQKLTRTRQ